MKVWKKGIEELVKKVRKKQQVNNEGSMQEKQQGTKHESIQKKQHGTTQEGMQQKLPKKAARTWARMYTKNVARN